LAVGAVVISAGMAIIALPLLATVGLTGFAVGLAVANLLLIATRVGYLRRMFPGLPIIRNAASAALPTLPAAALVLALRVVEGSPTGPEALSQVALFLVTVILSTLVLERRLVRETIGYLRRPVTA
jgi:hypothetical protein